MSDLQITIALEGLVVVGLIVGAVVCLILCYQNYRDLPNLRWFKKNP